MEEDDTDQRIDMSNQHGSDIGRVALQIEDPLLHIADRMVILVVGYEHNGTVIGCGTVGPRARVTWVVRGVGVIASICKEDDGMRRNGVRVRVWREIDILREDCSREIVCLYIDIGIVGTASGCIRGEEGSEGGHWIRSG